MTMARSGGWALLAVLCSCGQPSSGTAAPAAANEDVAPSAPAPVDTVAPVAPAAAVPIAAPGNAAVPDGRNGQINANTVAALKDELVGSGKLDGQPITDVEPRGACNTAFVAGGETVVVHWAAVGNFAGTVAGGTATIPIDDGKGAHSFTMPETPTFRRVNGGFGVLADNCAR